MNCCGTFTYQTSDQTQDSIQQEADGSENLEQRLSEESPERVELLLGVRHVVDLALGVVDALGDGAGELVNQCQCHGSEEKCLM